MHTKHAPDTNSFYNKLSETYNKVALLQNYHAQSLSGTNLSDTINEQRVNILSDLYYDALEEARGLDQGKGMTHFERTFKFGALLVLVEENKADHIIKTIQQDSRQDLIHNDIVNNPKGIREHLYSLTHKHMTDNKDKKYTQSSEAQSLLGFLRNQCPSMIRKKRMDNYSNQIVSDNYIPSTLKI
jgi:hypothetical protein